MAHTHAVTDTDKHFVIDPITRAITNQSEKLSVMQGDHNSERYTFEIPLTVEEHNMSLCNRVEIHYLNVKADRSEQKNGVYVANDVQAEGENLTFSWLISGNATEHAGNLNFAIVFKCIAEDGTIDYRWKTAICKGISVGESYDNGEAITEEYADILAEWDARITALEQSGGTAGANGKSAYEIALDNGFEGTETEWLESLKGVAGEDGYSPTANAAQTDSGAIITIVDKNGETSVTIENGKDGAKGEKGDPATNIIQSVNGQTGDVVLTAEDVGALSSTKWRGKRFGVIGDSQTETNSHKSVKWAKHLLDALQFKAGTSAATSGYTIANNETSYGNFMTNAKKLPYATDIIFVMGGVNDVWFNSPMGEIGSTDNTTFYGAMEELCVYLLNKYPEKTIVFITPTEQNNERCNAANTTGLTATDFAQAMKEVCAKYSIPVFDANASSGIYPLVEKNALLYTTDNLHLNDAGHKRLGCQLISFVQNTCYVPEGEKDLPAVIGATKYAYYTNKAIYISRGSTYGGVDLPNVTKMSVDMSYYNGVPAETDNGYGISWFGFKQSDGSYIAVSPQFVGSNEGLDTLKGEEWQFNASLTTTDNHRVNLWNAPTTKPQVIEATFDNGVGKIYFDNTEVYSTACVGLAYITSGYYGSELAGVTLTFDEEN